MIIVRNEQELLALVRDIEPDVKDADGEYRDPPRCSRCREMLTPSIERGRVLLGCNCDSED